MKKNLNARIAAWLAPGQAIARAELAKYPVIGRWGPRAMVWLTFAVIAANRR